MSGFLSRTFAPSPENVPSSGVGRGGFNPEAIRAMFARGASGAGAAAQQSATARALTSLPPDDLRQFERETRFLERQKERSDRAWDRWQNRQDDLPGGKVVTASDQSTSDRVLGALPLVGVLAGGAAPFVSPRAAELLSVGKVKSPVLKALLSAGQGATLGWLPKVTAEGVDSVMGKSGSYEGFVGEEVVTSLVKAAQDAFSLGEARAMSLIKEACWPMPGMGHDTSGDADSRMIAKSLDSLAAQSLELKKRVERGGVKMPSWAEYKVYKAADAIKDALSSAFTMHSPTVRITIIRAAKDGAKLAAHSVLR